MNISGKIETAQNITKEYKFAHNITAKVKAAMSTSKLRVTFLPLERRI